MYTPAGNDCLRIVPSVQSLPVGPTHSAVGRGKPTLLVLIYVNKQIDAVDGRDIKIDQKFGHNYDNAPSITP